MTGSRRNPWHEAAVQPGGRRHRGLLAAAVALGVGLGLLLPLGPPKQVTPAAGSMPQVPVPVPDGPAAPRPDSPLPLPPAPPPETARKDAGRGFGFCAGREGENCVIDGDSFRFGGEAVRLAGIDTPEIGGAQCADERARGEAAERRLHALLNAGEVQLVRVGGRDRDRFGRLLRDAEVDGASVSEALVAEGFARRWTGQREPWC